MMWKAGLALLGALAGSPALAEFATGDALVIGNARYGETTAAFGPAEVDAVARALRLRGQQVEALANGGTGPMVEAFQGFRASIEDGESPLVVVLSGQFGQGADGLFLLSATRDTAPGQGLSLAAVLDVLAQSPRRAFLVLGEAGAPAGLDALDIPEGVTVIRGSAAQVAQFAAREMAQPGARLERTAEWYDLLIAGYLSEGLTLLAHTEVRPPTEAEQAAARARAAQADARAWQRATGSDRLAAYQAYLDSFPEGAHAEDAQQRMAETDLALDPAGRRAVQRDLTVLGFDTRGIDGLLGPATRAAIAAWQERVDMTVTGYLDAPQVARLAKEAGAQAGVPREPVPAEVLQGRQQVRAAVPTEEVAAWNRARGEAGLRRYLGQYPDGAYARRAQVMLSNIQRGAGR